MLLPTKKSIILKEKKSRQEKLIAIFLSQINLDEHISTKINTFIIYKGGLAPQKQKKFKKKSNKMEAFPYLFFCFLARLPNSLKL